MRVRPHFGEVVQVRTGGPGDDTLADVRAHRRAVAAHVAEGSAGSRAGARRTVHRGSCAVLVDRRAEWGARDGYRARSSAGRVDARPYPVRSTVALAQPRHPLPGPAAQPRSWKARCTAAGRCSR